MSKLLILAVFLTVANCALKPEEYSPALKDIADELHFQCQMLTGVKEDDINEIRGGKLKDNIEIKRFFACLWIHSGVLSVGKLEIDEALAKKMEPPNSNGKTVQIFSSCAKKGRESGEKDILEKIWSINVCVFNTDPENFIIP
ncbi:unnamed protein product [Phyllotreta striolata]|uniref:Uncharacterized protein n=1 Tax=Phyllotreta striolata TaxID=444603 RepID=A0A9N9TZW6_PHYSR|nr:unnamed protein product [Phyllotreta striolata]